MGPFGSLVRTGNCTFHGRHVIVETRNCRLGISGCGGSGSRSRNSGSFIYFPKLLVSRFSNCFLFQQKSVWSAKIPCWIPSNKYSFVSISQNEIWVKLSLGHTASVEPVKKYEIARHRMSRRVSSDVNAQSRQGRASRTLHIQAP